MISFKELKEKTKSIETDIYALYKAYRDPRVPWHVKIIILFLLGYFISPINLIPDFIPVIGYIDDILIISLTIYLIIKLIPAEVFQNCVCYLLKISPSFKSLFCLKWHEA
ncbi:MAG: DUF1232 domain-containing protein [Candidatus Methanofastidiosum sp.]|nr:DUF1232 domain-containing protein [Methanofastidiosum sp.]